MNDTDSSKNKFPLTGILALLLFVCVIAGIGFILATAQVSLSGGASLPNGSQLDITTTGGILSGYSVATNDGTTKVETSGYTVEFKGSEIIVNGETSGTLPESSDCQLLVDRDGLRVTSGEDVLAQVD